MAKSIYVFGTMDTKGEEVAFLARLLRAAGETALTVDVGTAAPPTVRPDISRDEVLKSLGEIDPGSLPSMDRGLAVEAMSRALIPYLQRMAASGSLAGVLGIGGSGGTALIAPAFRALPIGIPKILVSTVASGNIAPYVGCSDIAMFPSVVDVAGLNAVSIRVLSNAAHALLGMVRAPEPTVRQRRAVGMTMFGVTTPCVTEVRQALEAKAWDCLVFHATGSGGQAMENLVSSGLLTGLLDLTTTEVVDEIVGGVFRAGPARFDVLATHPLPCVASVGAMDMVNFAAMATVPEAFRQRKLHIHNSNVTLMRTTAEENRQAAAWMADKWLRARGPLVVLLPEHGVSALDAPGKPFYDPQADEALFSELERRLASRRDIRVRRIAAHINEPGFAQAAVEEFLAIAPNPEVVLTAQP